MRVGLFISCYVDQFYPNAAISTFQLLKKFGVDVIYPQNQTYCGQPMANSGFENLTKGCDHLFINNFSEFDCIVSPSDSCVLHIEDHLHSVSKNQEVGNIRHKIYELVEFLTDILRVDTIGAHFPFKVGLHQSCHGQRGIAHFANV